MHRNIKVQKLFTNTLKSIIRYKKALIFERNNHVKKRVF